ncbi:glycoside hydrolase family 32 protein [Brachybacterium sp. DNPG3]
MTTAPDVAASSRPQFHLTAPQGRINDPNGLIMQGGTAHAFFQWGPGFPTDRRIGWGHAVSEDLLRWTIRPQAIAPDTWYDEDGCYSGGAVVQPEGAAFLYTGNVKKGDVRQAHQALLRTADFETFEKSPQNPVLPDARRPEGYTAHFRDPMVFETSEDGYRMCLGVQRTDLTGAILLHSAPALEGPWTVDGEMTFTGPHAAELRNLGYMWECPAILVLHDHELGRDRHVLIFCPQGAGVEGSDPETRPDVAGYVVGDLVGTELRAATAFRPLDLGFEFYAPQAFAGREGTQDAVLLAWLGNPAQDDQPSLAEEGWVHTLSLPRRLSLHGGILRHEPAVELAQIGRPTPVASLPTELTAAPSAIAELAGARSFALRAVVELDPDADADADADAPADAATPSLALEIAAGEHAVRIELDAERLRVDRSASRYPLGGAREATLPPASGPRRLTVVHDRSVTEIFVDDLLAFSLRSFLGSGEPEVRVAAPTGRARLVGPIAHPSA